MPTPDTALLYPGTCLFEAHQPVRGSRHHPAVRADRRAVRRPPLGRRAHAPDLPGRASSARRTSRRPSPSTPAWSAAASRCTSPTATTFDAIRTAIEMLVAARGDSTPSSPGGTMTAPAVLDRPADRLDRFRTQIDAGAGATRSSAGWQAELADVRPAPAAVPALPAAPVVSAAGALRPSLPLAVAPRGDRGVGWSRGRRPAGERGPDRPAGPRLAAPLRRLRDDPLRAHQRAGLDPARCWTRPGADGRGLRRQAARPRRTAVRRCRAATATRHGVVAGARRGRPRPCATPTATPSCPRDRAGPDPRATPSTTSRRSPSSSPRSS